MNLRMRLHGARKSTSTGTTASKTIMAAAAAVLATLLVFVIAIFGVTSTVFAQDEAPDQVLGPGDTVRVTVFQSPELTTEGRISSQGTLVFPLIGEVELASLTPIEAGAAIADRLSEENFVVDPEVSVTLVETRSSRVSILGHVANPGKYPLDGAQHKLSDLLALAGGIRDGGDDTVIVVTQRNGHPERFLVNVPEMYQQGDLSADIELSSGDTVWVPVAPVFFVYGAVQRPGEYRLNQGISVLNAITLGGGLTDRGAERGVKIHRRMPDGSTQVLKADLSDPVEANDVIRVRERFF